MRVGGGADLTPGHGHRLTSQQLTQLLQLVPQMGSRHRRDGVDGSVDGFLWSAGRVEEL